MASGPRVVKSTNHDPRARFEFVFKCYIIFYPLDSPPLPNHTTNGTTVWLLNRKVLSSKIRKP